MQAQPSISQKQLTTSTLVLEDDQDVPNSCAGIQSEDESLFHSECIDGFDHKHDDDDNDEGETSDSEESKDDNDDDEGRARSPEAGPEADHDDENFHLFSEKEPCLLVVQHPEVMEPFIPIKTYSGYPLVTRHQGYRLCGDNIDKTVHRRHLHLDHQNLSLHYFHTYAVENLIDFTELSDESREGLYANISVNDKHSMAVSLLPTQQDDQIIRNNISKLISRVLVTHLKFFKLSS